MAALKAQLQPLLKKAALASQVVLVVKNLPAMQETQETWVRSSTPGSGRSPGREHGNPLQDSCLENPMNRGA